MPIENIKQAYWYGDAFFILEYPGNTVTFEQEVRKHALGSLWEGRIPGRKGNLLEGPELEAYLSKESYLGILRSLQQELSE